VSGSRFDRTADRYLEQARRRDWSAVVELCRPGAGDRALDVGAGPGLLSAALAPRVARAVALDPSPAMLERAPAGVETAEGTGEAIPFEARIIAACDAYNAMTTTRPYREAMDPAAAAVELQRCSGSQFDPTVVEALLAVAGPAAPARLHLAA